MKKKKAKRRARYRVTSQPRGTRLGAASISSFSTRAATIRAAEVDISATQKDKYKYLLADLRYIGIVAASLFAILIVLSFVLS